MDFSRAFEESEGHEVNIPEVDIPAGVAKGRQRSTAHWEGLYDAILDASQKGKGLSFTPELFVAWAGDRISRRVVEHIVGDEIRREAEPRRFVGVLAWPEIKARLDACAKRRGHFAGQSPLRHEYQEDKRLLNIWIVDSTPPKARIIERKKEE